MRRRNARRQLPALKLGKGQPVPVEPPVTHIFTSRPATVHSTPHLNETGFCVCSCDDCTGRLGGMCFCLDCRCECEEDDHKRTGARLRD